MTIPLFFDSEDDRHVYIVIIYSDVTGYVTKR